PPSREAAILRRQGRPPGRVAGEDRFTPGPRSRPALAGLGHRRRQGVSPHPRRRRAAVLQRPRPAETADARDRPAVPGPASVAGVAGEQYHQGRAAGPLLLVRDLFHPPEREAATVGVLRRAHGATRGAAQEVIVQEVILSDPEPAGPTPA